MDEYNDLEVNLAETAAVDDSQEEIIVLEEYQVAQDSYHVTQDNELQSNVLSITDESIGDSMLEVAEAGGPLGGGVDLVYASPTAEPSDTQPWHELQQYVVLDEGEEDDEAKPVCIVGEDGLTEFSATGGLLTDGEEIVAVTLPQQTEADTTHVPEVIAMETVITTQPLTGTQTEILEGSGEINQDGQFMVYEITSQSTAHATDPEVLYVQASLKDQKKRMQDRVKKKELRQDPDYRAKERVKSRERMKMRRQDPTYREKEREKDRARREFVRKHDPVQREKERERDRNSKRMNRIMSKDTNFMDVAPFFDSVSLADMSGSDVT